MRLRSDGRIHVRSAGGDPAEELNPAVIEAMDEIGVDTRDESPKPLTDEALQAADVVITMSTFATAGKRFGSRGGGRRVKPEPVIVLPATSPFDVI